MNAFTVEGNRTAVGEMENLFLLIFKGVNLRKWDQIELKVPKLVGELVVPLFRSSEVSNCTGIAAKGEELQCNQHLCAGTTGKLCLSQPLLWRKQRCRWVKENCPRFPCCAVRNLGSQRWKLLHFIVLGVSILFLMTNATVSSWKHYDICGKAVLVFFICIFLYGRTYISIDFP